MAVTRACARRHRDPDSTRKLSRTVCRHSVVQGGRGAEPTCHPIQQLHALCADKGLIERLDVRRWPTRLLNPDALLNNAVSFLVRWGASA